MSQISLFDGSQPLKITKPIRLIECFAGYGSQALALKYLGVDFEDADYENARKALNEKFYKGKDKSGSQLYKQAGNSIVVNCLCEIFKEML